MQQLDTYYILPENFVAAANTQALYQAHLRAQMNQTGHQGKALPSITNQGTEDNHSSDVNAQGASSPPIQQPVLPQPCAPQVNQYDSSQFFPNAQFQMSQSRRLKHQV